MSESALVRSVLLAYGTDPRYRLYRNNVGVARGLTRDTPIRFGLCTGSSDIIGIAAPEGRFIAIECKTGKARTTKEQLAFLRMVSDMGGISGVVRSLEDAERILGPPHHP